MKALTRVSPVRRARALCAAQSIAVLAAAIVIVASAEAEAKGGSSVSVSTSAGAVVSVVSGVVTIDNAGSKAVSVTSVRSSIEVRFASGVTPPPLPAGSASGWYLVASVNLPAPGAVAANGSRSVAFSIDTCAGGVPSFANAKDMRSAAVVSAGDTYTARSLTFALPAKCPVCGNGIVETGEQCDQGKNGAACCSPTCRFRADGTVCNDGDACTRSDQCQAGACVGGNPVVCSATDACHVAGVCNSTTGSCSTPAKPNGSPCNDGNACTQTDSCQSGFCLGGNPVVCSSAAQCQETSCDAATGTCAGRPKVDGSECMDGDACTVGDHCVAGACESGAARDCNDHLSCTDDVCEMATGCAHATAPCATCDAAECAACGVACDTAAEQCASNCWSGFWSCLNGCTTTYCAPFCQVDLGRCLESCPAMAICRSDCDAGNGCAAACTPL